MDEDDLLTPEEMAELAEDGATFSFEKDEPVEINEWSTLVQQMHRIATASEKMADKQSSKINEALDNIAKIIATKKNVDMTPIIAMLADIRENTSQQRREVKGFGIQRKSQNQLINYVSIDYADEKTIN